MGCSWMGRVCVVCVCSRLCCNRQQSHDNCKPLSQKPDSDCCDTVKHGTELDRLIADSSLLTRVKDVNTANQSGEGDARWVACQTVSTKHIVCSKGDEMLSAQLRRNAIMHSNTRQLKKKALNYTKWGFCLHLDQSDWRLFDESSHNKSVC